MKLHRAVIISLGIAFMAACGDDNPQIPADSTAPARVADLAIVGHDATSFTLRWTAPGDDGSSGTASSYRLKRSDAPIDATNFSAATTVSGVPAPSTAGSVESFTVTGLDSTLTYHFALRTVDDAGNVSLVSNNAVWQPPQPLVKVIPPFKDNTMYEEGDFSNGAGQHLFTGRAGAGNPFARRALMAFAIADSLPAGAVIDSVRLTLHVSRVAAGSGARTTALHALTADWGEGTSIGALGEGAGAAATPNDVTWVYRFFNTATWTAPGGDFAAGASAQRSVNNIGFYTWSSAGMAADVQGWLDTPANNFGWILIGDESVNTIAKRFDSRENFTAANRPKLTVYYTAP